MEEIGLFPLGMVLLPTEQVPLHIFEERYQELIRECLDEEREFGLVYADDDGLREIGTRAVVTEVMERFEDGRMNVVVEGRERFRLVELTSGRSFHTGEIEAVADDRDPAALEDVERALELFRKLVDLTGAEVEAPDSDEPQLSFAIAARFDFAAELKQELLQETSERARIASLCRLLEAAAAAVERQQEIAARAQTNGRVHPRGGTSTPDG
jgi:Lon protease-like protein